MSAGQIPNGREGRASLDVSRETRERLSQFVALLQKWQAVKNLVGLRTLDDVWARHIEDSLQLADVQPFEGIWADVGSGAGLPGVVIAIAMSEGSGSRSGMPRRHVHLIESNGRKAAFLLDVVRQLDLPATVHPKRWEAVLPGLGDVNVITARAFAPLPSLLSMAHPIVDKGGIAVFPKGQDVDAELTEATRFWKLRYRRYGSRTDPAASILRIDQLALRELDE